MSNPIVTDIAIKSNESRLRSSVIALPRKQKIIGYFSMVTQFLTWPIAWAFFHSFYKVEITGQENLKKIKSTFMIISNHVASYDSFAYRLVLGFFTPHLPLRFMAVEEFNYWYLNFFMRIGVLKVLYALFGVFVVIPGRGVEDNLKTAIDIIAHGGNVVIYPEGKIVKKDSVAEFKRGAAVLAMNCQVPVLPTSFRISGEEGRAKKMLTVNIGEPLWLPENMNEENVTQIFYNSVVNLYNK